MKNEEWLGDELGVQREHTETNQKEPNMQGILLGYFGILKGCKITVRYGQGDSAGPQKENKVQKGLEKQPAKIVKKAVLKKKIHTILGVGRLSHSVAVQLGGMVFSLGGFSRCMSLWGSRGCGNVACCVIWTQLTSLLKIGIWK